MKRHTAALLVAAIISTSLGASVALSQQPESPNPPAGEKVCLQANRMMNYDIIDERALRITDRFFKNYTVRMASGCVGLTKAATNVVLRLRSSLGLGCLGQGDSVAFNSPGLGPVSCLVTSVEAYVPPAPKQAESKP
jgi:hypothetical protein